MKTLIFILAIFFSGCITIKIYPTIEKKDTVYLPQNNYIQKWFEPDQHPDFTLPYRGIITFDSIFKHPIYKVDTGEFLRYNYKIRGTNPLINYNL